MAPFPRAQAPLRSLVTAPANLKSRARSRRMHSPAYTFALVRHGMHCLAREQQRSLCKRVNAQGVLRAQAPRPTLHALHHMQLGAARAVAV